MKTKLIVMISLILMMGCSPALYDHYTFTRTVEIKVQTESLIKRSNTAYEINTNDINALKDQLYAMSIYEKSKGKNPITMRMWEFLNNENSSIHRFLRLWKEKKTLNPAFAAEFGEQTNEIFDHMITYETKKDKQSEAALIGLMKNL